MKKFFIVIALIFVSVFCLAATSDPFATRKFVGNDIEISFREQNSEGRPQVSYKNDSLSGNYYSASMEGRLFIQFIALILLTEIRKVIKEKGSSFAKYCTNPRGLFKRVFSFSRISFKGKYKDIYSVPTKAQRLIFEAFGIDIPLTDEGSC